MPTRRSCQRLSLKRANLFFQVVALVVAFAASTAQCRAQDTTQFPATKSTQAQGESVWENKSLLGFPEPPPPLKAVRRYPGIHLPQLITIGKVPHRSLILAADHERGYAGPSRVYVFEDRDDITSKSLFLERPEIIYGFAFHPEFPRKPWVYVGCNGHSDQLDAIATRVLKFRVTETSPMRCIPESASVVIEWPSNGHNGGDLEFGPDGMLYISTGDGTSDSDANRTGQDLSNLNAAMLRIDVNRQQGSLAYAIPEGNPFQGFSGARAEIWAFGLRNPWRITFDQENNRLWAGNNGQDMWESVYLVEKGANYGWSVMESNHPFHTGQQVGPVPISPAIVEHHHSEARSLTGGVVYRGKHFPDLDGAYIYGDYSTGYIWALKYDGRSVSSLQKLARTSLQIVDFGIDSSGEVLIADHEGGLYGLVENEVHRDVPKFPDRLSQTGLFSNLAQETTKTGVIPYEVNAPLWSDGASKKRWFALPPQDTLKFKERGSFEFPDTSVLVKSFAFPTAGYSGSSQEALMRKVETRIMVKLDGEWFGYSYRWNEEQTDAFLIEAEGRNEDLDWIAGEDESKVISWRYPSRSECMVCHSRAANFVLGVAAEQLHTSESEGSPLQELAMQGVFGESFDMSRLHAVTPLVDPHDEQQPVELRARSYLHANCSGCHVKEGGGNSKINLSFFTPSDKMNLWEQKPMHGLDQAKDTKLAKAGSPAKSVLLQRLARRGAGQMPPLGSNRVDPQAVELIRSWIREKAPER